MPELVDVTFQPTACGNLFRCSKGCPPWYQGGNEHNVRVRHVCKHHAGCKLLPTKRGPKRKRSEAAPVVVYDLDQICEAIVWDARDSDEHQGALTERLEEWGGARDFMADPKRATDVLAKMFACPHSREAASRCIHSLCEHVPETIFKLRLWGLLPAMVATLPGTFDQVNEPTVYRALSALVDADDANAVALTRLGAVRCTVDALTSKPHRNPYLYSHVAEFLRSVFSVHEDAVLENGALSTRAALELKSVLGATAEELLDQVEAV